MDKEQVAIMRIQEASEMSLKIYGQPLIITDSGGKDSSVCVELARRSGIPYEIMHNHTTADAPETVYFVREKLKSLEAAGVKCTIEYPMLKGKRSSMWDVIAEWGPPNRWNRHCCSILKERGGNGRFIVTGVRWGESIKRKSRGVYETAVKDKDKKIILNNDNDEKRMLFETCQLKAKRVCNPIIDWTDRDVWDFLRSEKIEVNPLYAEGWNRVGCVGCPLASTKGRYAQFARWPKYKRMYMLAFERNIAKRKGEGRSIVRDNVDDMWHWWMDDGVLPGQISLDDVLGETDI